MPTCRDIITAAFRKGRVYAPGEEPSSDDMNDGLDELQNLYEQWGAGGMFGQLTDVATADDYEASPGERVVVTDTATITIPGTFAEDGTDYPAYTLSFVEVVDVPNGTVFRYLYENGVWTDIASLTLDDEAPLAGRGKMGLAACLTMQMDSWNAEILPSTMRQAASFKTSLSLKLGSDAQRTAPDYF